VTDDYLPPIDEQAAGKAWRSGRYTVSDEQIGRVRYFNPTILATGSSKKIIFRRWNRTADGSEWGHNTLVAFDEKNSLKVKDGTELKFIGHRENQHYEDPRAFKHDGKIYISYCTFLYYGKYTGWSGARQAVSVLEEDLQCVSVDMPGIGGNLPFESMGGHNEKNWLWFFSEGKLCLAYSFNRPWIIAEFGATWNEHKTYKLPRGLTWEYGTIRGGTPPVLLDGLCWSFFHSSIPWPVKGYRRRYYAGALGFESRPPFHPKRITLDPLLAASDRDLCATERPLCIFPCGAIMEKGIWHITFGVNDTYSGWVKIPHEDILKRCTKIK
jgi:predicted GH43/DUF377 family glycosyl hydrolase